MKSAELQMLWKLVKSGESRKLSAADFALLLRLRYALQEYEGQGEQQTNRAVSSIPAEE